MTPEEFRQIAQQNIFPGESGGDYGALFGYAGREGGQFAGVDPQRMTLNQLLEFQDPNGPYGQWVKQQNNGTVSTPAGAYQIVGRTLRGAMGDMGLTGNEMFDQQMQDAIGAHIYQTQGPGAWEGWRGDRGGSQVSTMGNRNPPQAVAADAAGLLGNGGGQMAAQEQPQGLLGMLGIQKRDESAGGQTALPFYQRDQFADVLGGLASGFNSMRLNPDESIPQQIQARQAGRQQKQQANRTIEWLRSQPGGERFAEMAQAAGPQAALQAYQASMQGPEQTSGMQNYQFLLAQGIDPKTAMERAFGGGGTNVTTNVGTGETEFTKETGKILAKEANDVVQQAAMAQRSMGQLDTLEQALQNAPEGAGGAIANMAANIGIKTEGASSIELANAIISQLVPQQRPPGSGVMSDADLALFKASLPRLINTKEGNQLIINTMRNIAEYDMQRGQIARRLQLGEITPDVAFNEYNALGNPLSAFQGQNAPTAPTGGAGGASAPDSEGYVTLPGGIRIRELN